MILSIPCITRLDTMSYQGQKSFKKILPQNAIEVFLVSQNQWKLFTFEYFTNKCVIMLRHHVTLTNQNQCIILQHANHEFLWDRVVKRVTAYLLRGVVDVVTGSSGCNHCRTLIASGGLAVPPAAILIIWPFE